MARVLFMKTDQTETDLIRAAAGGDAQAFNRLVLEHREGALMLAVRLLRSTPDAEDVVQDAFVKVWEELVNFRGDSKFSSWLYRIVYNLSLNKIRSRGIRRFFRIGESDEEDSIDWNLPSDDPLPDEVLIDTERKQRLEKAILKLPAKQRSIFIMRHEQGLTNSEIASITNKSEGSVKANFSFALAKLKQELDEEKDR